MYDNKRAHNMLSLMLDLAYKTLRLTPHTLGESRVLQLLKSMTKSLLPMFLQCYQHLHFTKCLGKCFIYMTLLVTIMFGAFRNNMLILPLTYGITFLLLDLWTWISSLELFIIFCLNFVFPMFFPLLSFAFGRICPTWPTIPHNEVTRALHFKHELKQKCAP